MTQSNTKRTDAEVLSKAAIDAIVYACRQAGDDSTYAIVNACLAAALAARPTVAAADAEAIRSAALEEAANEICTLARRFTTDYTLAVTDAVHAIRALSQPSPAVKSAEPDYRDLYEKCKREKAAAYERLAKYEDVKMVRSAEPALMRQAVATVVSRVGDDLRVGWLQPERCDVGTLLYCAVEPTGGAA